MNKSPLFAVFPIALLSLAGCSGGDQATASGLSATSSATAAATASAKSSASATATPTAKPTAKPKADRKPPKGYTALRADLEKKCPIEAKDTNVEQKEAAAKALECLRKKMIADLDAVLLPLKKKDETKFKALMKEQAEWNRNVEVACRLEEERFWVDLKTGLRDDGTMRSYPYMGCIDKAYTERILLAQSLASGKLDPLVKRIGEVDADGLAVENEMKALRSTADAFVLAPPKEEDGMAVADWKTISADVEKVQTAVANMAKSTCDTWPDLSKALGKECVLKVGRYYYVQGQTPNAGRE
ncbi:MAG: hypothetical protein IPK82_11715 [Polyangiaceae bacterium]|nr:hypothetical protein [Polyangiaceae bacterium]